MFDGLPGVLPKLLPPSVGGPKASNENGDPPAPEVEEEAPATERDPAPWGEAAATAEWGLLKEGAEGVG